MHVSLRGSKCRTDQSDNIARPLTALPGLLGCMHWRAARVPMMPERRFPGFQARTKRLRRKAPRTAMRILAAFVLTCLFAAAPASAQEKSITVFAAASMKNALDDINAAFLTATGIKVVASYAASSVLARQIEQGAPADIFASADVDWMDYAAQRKTIRDETRVNLLGNRP